MKEGIVYLRNIVVIRHIWEQIEIKGQKNAKNFAGIKISTNFALAIETKRVATKREAE